MTRPDLSYSVGLLNQFLQTQCDTHLNCVMAVCKYVSGTLDQGVFVWKDTLMPTGPVVYVIDGQHPESCSHSGAELSRGVAKSIRQLHFEDFNESVDEPIRIYCDNQSNIQLARNSVFHPRTKHIEVHYCYVREHIIVGDIDIVYICTNLQMVDIFTKTLGTTKLQQFSLALDLRPFNTTSLCHMLEEEPKLLTGKVEAEQEPTWVRS